MAPKRNAVGTAAAIHPPVGARTPPTNGILTSDSNPPAGVNRKKAKRRAKEAAKRSEPAEVFALRPRHPSDFVEPARVNGQLPHRDGDTPLAYDPNEYYYPDPMGGGGAEEDFAYSEDDQFSYDEASQDYIEERAMPPRRTNGHAPSRKMPPTAPHHHAASDSHHTGPRPISDDALRTVQRGINSGTWNMSNIEERRQIRDYWLSLNQSERKALVKIEKSDVLLKMKEQQKHSCSCTVCGRKRVAIEEELEILYDAYYKELEQYANHSQLSLDNRETLPPPPVRPTSRSPPPPRRKSPPRHRVPRGRVVKELPEEEEELDDPSDEEELEYSQDEEYDGDLSEEGEDHLPPQAHEFFTFGNSLTVKGGILTVADDLLKNDGQKFIDMMEQLAERRMQREEQALNGPLTTHNPHPHPPQHSHGNHGNHAPHSNHADHGHPPPEDEEYDDEEDEDYDSQEEDYDEEDDVDAMTETQRMEEGRRMFQIFAARMFEQRVLDAYRQKRAADRAALLIQEEAEEAERQDQSSAKSAKKNEKKRLKEKQKKQQLKEEKERKDAERAAAQAEEERRKQEEQKRKQEEARKKQEAKAEERRKKAEAARKAQEEEKARKRAEELERKSRDQKAKEEKKQREEAERKEKEMQERKMQQDREAKAEAERLEKAKVEQEVVARRSTDQARPAEPVRRAPIPAVALPPALRTKSSAGLDSPQVKIATPVLPKAPAPVRPREFPNRTSQDSTPQTPEAIQAKQPTPPSQASSQPTSSQQSTASRARTPLHSATFTPQMSPMYNVAPPPGMSTPGPHLSHINSGGFPAMSSPMAPGPHRPPVGLQMSNYSPHTGPPGPQHRSFVAQNIAGLPPGIVPMSNGRQFPAEPMPSPAPSFKGYPAARSPGTSQGPSPGRENNLLHGRQPSMSASTPFAPGMERGLSISTHPIGKPNPIGRPQNDISFGRIRNPASAVEEIGARLGSSALLDDSDEPEPLPTSAMDNRRVSAPFGMPSLTSHPPLSGSAYDQVQSPFGQSLPKDNGWRSSSSTFGPPGLSAAPGWGGHAPTPAAGWGNPAPFPTTFVRPGTAPRPVSVRLFAVQSYRTLARSNPGVDGGFFDLNDVVRQAVNMSRTRGDKPPTRGELENILDTEGDAHNGGGLFSTKEDRINQRTLIKWHPDSLEQSRTVRPGVGLGDIGSPLPGNIPGIRPRAL